jgi:hypothetical protein
MRPIDAAIALRFEALRLARLAVRQELRSQGVKLSYIEASEITRQAKVWLDQNRAELIDVGLRNVLADVLRANLRTGAQKSNGRPVRVSSVQISGANDHRLRKG